MKILVINGPNINMLGIREKDIYGEGTYQSLIEFIKNVCDQNDIDVDFFQSNHEGAIIDEIQRAYGKYDGIVINPAAYTHTSVAILDALKAVDIKTVEVHLSNIYEREEFRHNSFVSAACVKTYMGKGFEGYKEAIIFLKNM
ncbi:MAG: type II 3-dehydroquinate dehydratase [Clostridia bacterium]|nr:type II 3-dehydroquinate dehydratase [Clostridia bacterium]